MAAKEFERVVRDAMQREGLSLIALARDAQIERGRFYTWFRGENQPTERSLMRLGRVLHTDVAELAAPWGSVRPGGTVTDPPGLTDLSSLTDAINRLAMALEGRTAGLAPEVREGISRDLDQAAGEPEPPSPKTPQSPPARSTE